MPATPRIRMVYKNKGLVKKGCCVVANCPPPTVGNITSSNCVFDGQYTTTCDYTVNSSGGTSFQWYYAVAPSYDPVAFVNGPRISGSQTPTLRMGATDQPISCLNSNIYCIVTNSCGSVQINNAPIVGGCPIVE